MTRNSFPIVVGYDGSELADDALRWASGTAGDQDTVIVVVAAPMSPAAESWGVEESSLEAMERVADQAEKAIASLGCPDATVELRHGEPTVVLERAAAQARLLVVGARGHGPFAALLGSVSRHLAAHATCPLVVVRPASGSSSRIVVGLDDQGGSTGALDFAMRRAEHVRAQVHALHAVRTSDPFGAELPLGADPCDASRRVRQTVDEARLAHREVDLTLETITARPAGVLVEASRDAALVVLGTRGRHPLTRRLLGSVGQQVLHHAHCPVAVVR